MRLQCDMEHDCTGVVSMIDDKGYAYCEPHGLARRSWTRCRKLRPAELNKLKRGEPLARY